MTLKVKDAEGQIKHISTTGLGTEGDPIKTQQSITGTVTIGQAIPVGDNNIGNIDVASLPDSMVSGDRLKVEATDLSSDSDSVAAVQSGAWSVGVSNFPTSFQVSNFPATQTVAGSVGVTNFPTSFQVSNFPATQTVAGSVGVTNFPTSFQVSNLSALATDTTLGTRLSEGTNITGVSLPAGGSGAFGWLSAVWKLISDRLPSVLVSDRFKVDGSGVIQPVSATSLPLPTGAATGANQATGNASLSSIDGKLPGNLTVTSNRLLVDTGAAGGGDASAANQTTQITRETEIRDGVADIAVRLPSTLGAKTAANSLAVTLSTNGAFSTNFGLQAEAAAGTDTATASFISLFKRLLQRLTSLLPQSNSRLDINIGSSNNSSGVLVKNVSNKFREDFPGSSLNGAIWNTIQTGAGQTISVSSSELTIAAGTTVNSETIIRSLIGFTIPMRVMFTALLSQRIINQEVYFEVTDSAGNNLVRLLFSGTGTTSSTFQTVNNNNALTGTNYSISSSLAYQIFEFDIAVDSVDLYTKPVDGITGRAIGATKTRFVPDPTQTYYLQIRVKNLGTAPASNTNLIIDSITCLDVEELSAEISGGRGSSNISTSIPVAVTNPISSITNSITVGGIAGGTAAIGDTGVQYRASVIGAASSSFVNSLATTNATNAKASVGRLLGFVLINTAASPRYLKFHNTSGTPTPGSGVIQTIPLAVGINNFSLEGGLGGFTTGIGYTITANPATTDTTAIGAGEIVGSIYFA